ncbi:hypothetical protein F383_21852 [Gossypium arboreum]|jgi:hypothetical protein|nr:hypothetical protein F383_21852 [Gossypium arboreum]
MHFLLL